MAEELKFRIADDLTISWRDYEVEGLRVAILARSGGGKSNLSALFAEAALESKLMPVCVIEPVEEWWTLRNRYDSVVWAGGLEDGADLPIYPDAPGTYTEILEKGGSLVLTAGVIEDEYEEKSFVARFLYSLYNKWKKIRRPILLIIEEADGYAPQMWTKEDRPCLSKIALLAKRGRKLGINLILVSQRPADIHKAALSQSNIIFLGGFKTTQDLEAVRALSKLLHLPVDTSEVAKLGSGEFYVFLGGEVKRVKAYLRKTPHGGSTPRLEKPVKPELRGVVSELRKALKDAWLRKQKEMDRVKLLERRVEELEQLLDQREKAIEDLKKKLEMKKIAEKAVEEKIGEVKEIQVRIRPEAEELRLPVAAEPVSRGLDQEELPWWAERAPNHVVQVYRLLRGAGRWMRPAEVREATGLSRRKVRQALVYLYNKGALRTRLGRRPGNLVFLEVKAK